MPSPLEKVAERSEVGSGQTECFAILMRRVRKLLRCLTSSVTACPLRPVHRTVRPRGEGLWLSSKSRFFKKSLPLVVVTFFSLSKNYTNAPVSGKMETGAMTWKNGKRIHGGKR